MSLSRKYRYEIAKLKDLQDGIRFEKTWETVKHPWDVKMEIKVFHFFTEFEQMLDLI